MAVASHSLDDRSHASTSSLPLLPSILCLSPPDDAHSPPRRLRSRKGKARAVPTDADAPLRRTRSTPTGPRPTALLRSLRRGATLGRSKTVWLHADSSEDELPPPPPSPTSTFKRRPRPRLASSLELPVKDIPHTDSGYASAVETEDCLSASASSTPGLLETDEELQLAAAETDTAFVGWSSRIPHRTVSALVLAVLAIALSLLPRQSPLRPRPVSPSQFWGVVTSAASTGWWWASRAGWTNLLLTSPLGLPSAGDGLLVGVLPLALLFLLRPRWTILHLSWYAALAVRLALGHIFCRGTGWAFPSFFWTDAAAESAPGLSVVLLTEAMRRWLKDADEDRERLLPTVLLLAAAGLKGHAWWGSSALVAGTILGLSLRRRQSGEAGVDLFRRLGFLVLPLLFLLAPARSSTSAVMAGPAHIDTRIPATPLVTVLLMTAPRPGHPAFLIDTLASYLSGFPSPTTSAQEDFRIVVYTHFSSHPVFDAALTSLVLFPGRPDLDEKAAHYVRWVRQRPLEDVDRLDQRLHLARALAQVANDAGEYVMLAEDDFPLCHEEGKGWSEVVRLVEQTRELMPDSKDVGHCGLFVGTGGSGLLIRRPLVQALPAVLLGEGDRSGDERERRALHGELDLTQERPPDIAIQRCVLGLDDRDACRACGVPSASSSLAPNSARLPWHDPADAYGKTGLAVSERLVMRHLGYNASTVPDRTYKPEEWGCNWRHPFNGDPSVLVLR